MDTIINEQSPDGLNITIKNIIVDTYDEAAIIIKQVSEMEKGIYDFDPKRYKHLMKGDMNGN